MGLDWVQAVVMGLIQGLTEFLPISSSGHLFLVPELMRWNDPGAGFTAVIQLGTIVAVFIYFWSDLVRTFMGWARSLVDRELRGSPEARTGWAIAVGTVLIAVVGLLLERWIDTTFRSLWVVAGTLIGFGLLMGLAERVAKQTRGMDSVTVRDGAVIGVWQCLALIPGSSRSGCTITGGLFLGLDRASAARFSFLLSIPAITLSGLYKLYKERGDLLSGGWGPTLVATVVAFVSGYAAIAFLMKFLQTRTTAVFVVYRVVLGLVILALGATGVIQDRPTGVSRGEVAQEVRAS